LKLRGNDHPLKPRVLRAGDRVALIAPSRPTTAESIDRAVGHIEQRGYEVVCGPHITAHYGYLAGSDEQRAADLRWAFQDHRTRAIICVRGGFGSGRILDRVDYDVVTANPKIFVGFSDTTALQLALVRKTGLVSFTGALADLDIRRGGRSSRTLQNLWRALESVEPLGRVPSTTDGAEVYSSGRCSGPLLGGCLALVCSLLGTHYQPNFDGSILLLEDVGEDPYRIDRMFNQLRLAGILEQISGLALGRFRGCFTKTAGNDSFTLEEIVRDHLAGLKIPVVANLPYGHYRTRVVLPLGVRAVLDADAGNLQITESAFSS
jgi:muramoyltetrapeptide carboxypeptidase